MALDDRRALTVTNTDAKRLRAANNVAPESCNLGLSLGQYLREGLFLNTSEQAFATYKLLRIWAGVLGILFPLILAVVGYFLAQMPPADSMSAYYHVAGPPPYDGSSVPGNGVMRNVFVGLLFAIGII